MYDCKNTECVVNQLHRISESKAMKDRMHIQELNGAKEMYAGYIAVKRKDARVSMYKIAQIAGCSPAEYSAYEHERKDDEREDDPDAAIIYGSDYDELADKFANIIGISRNAEDYEN